MWDLWGSTLGFPLIWCPQDPLGCPLPTPPDLWVPMRSSVCGGEWAHVHAELLIGCVGWVDVHSSPLGSVGEEALLGFPGSFSPREHSLQSAVKSMSRFLLAASTIGHALQGSTRPLSATESVSGCILPLPWPLDPF